MCTCIDSLKEISKLRSDLEAVQKENAILNRMVEALAESSQSVVLRVKTPEEVVELYRAEAEKEAEWREAIKSGIRDAQRQMFQHIKE
jgi:hypothetical protein